MVSNHSSTVREAVTGFIRPPGTKIIYARLNATIQKMTVS